MKKTFLIKKIQVPYKKVSFLLHGQKTFTGGADPSWYKIIKQWLSVVLAQVTHRKAVPSRGNSVNFFYLFILFFFLADNNNKN